jgi:hypothetical protein
MHAAAQVEAQVHRQRTDRRKPRGRGRKQVQRDDVRRVRGIGIQRLVDQVLRLELGVGVGEANADAVRIEQRLRVRNARFLERVLDASEQRGIDRDRGLDARDLDCGRFTEEIRQRVEERETTTSAIAAYAQEG